MFYFDDEFGLDDLIEADIQYGLFEEDDKKLFQKKMNTTKKKQQKLKSFFDFLKFRKNNN